MRKVSIKPPILENKSDKGNYCWSFPNTGTYSTWNGSPWHKHLAQYADSMGWEELRGLVPISSRSLLWKLITLFKPLALPLTLQKWEQLKYSLFSRVSCSLLSSITRKHYEGNIPISVMLFALEWLIGGIRSSDISRFRLMSIPRGNQIVSQQFLM